MGCWSIKILTGGVGGGSTTIFVTRGEERGGGRSRLGPDWRYPCPAIASRGSGECEKIRRPCPIGSWGSHVDSIRKESLNGESRGHCLQVEHRGDGGAVGRAGIFGMS